MRGRVVFDKSFLEHLGDQDAMPSSGAEWKVLICLLWHHNWERRSAWPKVETIVQKTSLHRSTVERALKRLETKGCIRVFTESGVKKYRLPVGQIEHQNNCLLGGPDRWNQVDGVNDEEQKKIEECSPAFLKAKKVYPPRKGSQNCPGAWRGWQKWLKAKKTPDGQEIMEEGFIRACKNYNAEQISLDNIGTEFVMQMSTFFGQHPRFSEYMSEDWNLAAPDTCGRCTHGGNESTYCTRKSGWTEPDETKCDEYET